MGKCCALKDEWERGKGTEAVGNSGEGGDLWGRATFEPPMT